MRLAVNPDHDARAFWNELQHTAHAVLVRLLQEGRVTVPDPDGADALTHAARLPGWLDQQGQVAIEASTTR
jgi:flagellar basal body rod protein FlgF